MRRLFLAAAMALSLGAFAQADPEFKLVIENHKFTPDRIEVPAGKKVKLVIENKDSTPEEFESKQLNREKVIPGKSTGTIFIGPWSAQAAGDYTTGSNHVLPTGGAARFRGGLGPADFVRTFTEQTVTRQGLCVIGPAAITLADAEGLTEHARSIRMRI